MINPQKLLRSLQLKREMINLSKVVSLLTVLTGEPNPKAGSCPAVPPGLGGYCVQECSSDYDCVGDRKCCSNGCGMTCVMPTSK